MDKCGDCSQSVLSKEKGLQCEICTLWFHGRCQGVFDDTYKFLQKNHGVHWYCKGGDRGVANIIKALSIMQEKQEKLVVAVRELGKEIGLHKAELINKMKELHKEVEGLKTARKMELS